MDVTVKKKLKTILVNDKGCIFQVTTRVSSGLNFQTNVVIDLIANNQFFYEDELCNIRISKKPYLLSNRLVVYNKGKKCRVSMFKFIVDISENSHNFTELFFKKGDESAEFSQSTELELSLDLTLNQCRDDAELPWWKYAWEMLKSPIVSKQELIE
eukprot:NODE_216_length_12483_cov_2.137516.p8 type:complete len:156 gc:universal NODE_216_length_12483_cov_2.137516:1144-1611(+)